MKKQITYEDQEIILQQSMRYHFRIEVRNNKNQIMELLDKVKAIGSLSIDADSAIRRTLSLTITLDEDQEAAAALFENYIRYHFFIQIGLFSFETNSYHYYPLGDFVITDANTAYHATDNSITFQLSDRMAELNGTINGQIGGVPITEFTLPESENACKHPVIKTLVRQIIKDFTHIENHRVDDIGQFDGLEAYNPDWEQFREDNKFWDKLPYDLTFDAGTSIYDMLITFRDLYPNYQVYLDSCGTLCFNLIPSCAKDPVVLGSEFLQEILISEQASYDRQAIRNVTEVFGKCFEADRFTSTSTWVSDQPATLKLNYGEDANLTNTTQIFVFKIKSNAEDTAGNTRSTAADNDAVWIKLSTREEPYPLYFENSLDNVAVKRGDIKNDQLYALSFHNANNEEYFNFLGESTPHAVCALSENEQYEGQDVTAYIKETYQCDNVLVRTVSDSPFSIQKLGLLTDVKYSGEFDNLTSSTAALFSAKHYNTKSTMMCDTITLTTKLLPFLDVHQKIAYKRQQEAAAAEPQHYVTKSITHDFGSGTSSITMYRFYPLYYPDLE